MRRIDSRHAPSLLLLIVAAVAGCGGKPSVPSPADLANDSVTTVTSAQRAAIATDTIAVERFTLPVITTGTVQFNGDRSTAVVPAISGPVSRIMAKPGDRVAPGDSLALVASPDFAAQVAELRKAETAWANADRIATLDQQLYAAGSLARSELDQARSDRAAALAEREAAMQQLRALGVDSLALNAIRAGTVIPDRAVIRSPIAGTIVQKFVTPGQLLQAGGGPAFTVADLSTVWVMGNVFESAIGSVRRGDRATITTRASTDSFVGVVDYVSAVEDPASKATEVRIVVPNPDRILKQNMLVDVSIQSATGQRGVVVPVAAVLRDDDNLPFVYVATAPDRFARRRITLGDRTGHAYQVTEGLLPGDIIVTNGALYLREAGSR